MRAALRTEFRKFTSTRLWWLLLVVMAGYMAFLGAVMAFSLGSDPSSTMMDAGGGSAAPLSDLAIAQSVYTLGNTLGYVFPLIIGALAVTTEFRHQTITPTFLFEPRRGVVLSAKLVAAAVIGLAYGAIGTLFAVVAGAPVLAHYDIDLSLDNGDVLTSIGLSVVALALWTLVGVGVGCVLPNQVASVVVILAFTQFVEPVLRIGMSLVDALAGVSRFLPGAAAESIVGASLYSESGALTLLARWQGALVLLGYVVVLALIGRITTFRRDIT